MSMGRVVTFEPVSLKGTKLMFALAGQSGDGKTFSALQLAWGLAGGDASKVFHGCLENGRGRMYRNILRRRDGRVEKYQYANLKPPFTPERLADLVLDAQDAGAEVLVVDTISHEWDGLGGCHSIAIATGGGGFKRNGEPKTNWAIPKRRHLEMMNVMLTCDMHIIFCVRAKKKVKVHKDGSMEELGVLPICEPQFMFEMTASWLLSEKGKRQDVLKAPPEELWPHLCREKGYLTVADGFAIRKWLMDQDDAPATTPEEIKQREDQRAHEREVERQRSLLESQTAQGAQHIRDQWKALSEEMRTALGLEWFHYTLNSAKAFEAEAEEAARAAAESTDGDEEGENLDALNAMLAGDDDDDD